MKKNMILLPASLLMKNWETINPGGRYAEVNTASLKQAHTYRLLPVGKGKSNLPYYPGRKSLDTFM
jgi:hypothetical protein